MSNDAEATLLERDAAHVIHPLHSRAVHAKGKVWVGGEGAYLVDANGERFIDGLSGLWNNTAGNGRRELIEAGSRQLEELAFASGYAGSSNPRAIELGEKIARLTYPNINQFYFTSGGGEATDSNIKMARYYWKLKGQPTKTKVISRILGYHGVTFAAMCATGLDVYWPMFEPLIPGFSHIPSPYPYFYQAPEGSESQGIAAADELEKAILAEGADTVAMFIAEPVQGAGGVIVPQDDYFPRIREICDKYEVLLVSDEVITGFGRTGKWFAMEHWGIEADIMSTAKAITGGYAPLGASTVTQKIADVLPIFSHLQTYQGHPAACAAGLATIEYIEQNDLIRQGSENGAYLLEQMQRLRDLPIVGDVRGLGMWTCVDFTSDKKTKAPFKDGTIKRIVHRCRDMGVLIGEEGTAVEMSPPYIASRDELDTCVDTLEKAIIAEAKHLGIK